MAATCSLVHVPPFSAVFEEAAAADMQYTLIAGDVQVRARGAGGARGLLREEASYGSGAGDYRPPLSLAKREKSAWETIKAERQGETQ